MEWDMCSSPVQITSYCYGSHSLQNSINKTCNMCARQCINWRCTLHVLSGMLWERFFAQKLLRVCLHAPQNFLIIYDEISSGTFENIIFNISTSFETTQIISSAICSSPPPSRCRQSDIFINDNKNAEKKKTQRHARKTFAFHFSLHLQIAQLKLWWSPLTSSHRLYGIFPRRHEVCRKVRIQNERNAFNEVTRKPTT